MASNIRNSNVMKSFADQLVSFGICEKRTAATATTTDAIVNDGDVQSEEDILEEYKLTDSFISYIKTSRSSRIEYDQPSRTLSLGNGLTTILENCIMERLGRENQFVTERDFAGMKTALIRIWIYHFQQSTN